jgi:hypothetical protein
MEKIKITEKLIKDCYECENCDSLEEHIKKCTLRVSVHKSIGKVQSKYDRIIN